MKKLITIVTIIVMVSPVLADWDYGDDHKMHYPQLPDLEFGLDVLDGPTMHEGAYAVKFLADDWKCSESGLVTDIHFWSSYNEDYRPDLPPPMFNIAIYDNIPEGPNGYSQPGNLLWSTYRAPDRERFYIYADEEFFDPNLNEIIGFDQTVWQYNFNIPETEAFWQEREKIYWLGVSYTADLNGDGIISLNDMFTLLTINPWAYGWKTSQDHFMDDAVFTDVVNIDGLYPEDIIPGGPVGPVVPYWRELIDPRTGESLDLAFVITPEPATMSLLLIGGLAVLIRRRK